MPEITCPHCHKVFQVEESDYEAIARQIRDKEFEKDVHEKLSQANQIAVSNAAAELAKKEAELAKVKAELANAENAKKAAISELTAQKANEINEKQRKIDALQNEIRVNEEKKKLKVMVKIFGRKTPLELSFVQVEKLKE